MTRQKLFVKLDSSEEMSFKSLSSLEETRFVSMMHFVYALSLHQAKYQKRIYIYIYICFSHMIYPLVKYITHF